MKISNDDYIKAIAKKTGFTQKDIKEVFLAAQDEASLNLQNGDSVKVFKWLTLETVNRAERTARNPKTGEPITISAKKAPKAKFSKTLKELLN